MISQFAPNPAMFARNAQAPAATKGMTQGKVNQQAALCGGSFVVASRVTRSKQQNARMQMIGARCNSKKMLDGLKKVGSKKKA